MFAALEPTESSTFASLHRKVFRSRAAKADVPPDMRDFVTSCDTGLRLTQMPQAPNVAHATVAVARTAHDSAPGPTEDWSVWMAIMRRSSGALSAAPDATSQSIFKDEGAEMNVITKAALQRASADFAHGHPPLSQREPSTAPSLLVLNAPMAIQAFTGAGTQCLAIARAHLRLGYAVYDCSFFVVQSAPADIVLGLPFRTRFCRQMPNTLLRHAKPLWEVTRLFLGVPIGRVLQVPAIAATTPNTRGKPHMSAASCRHLTSTRSGTAASIAAAQCLPRKPGIPGRHDATPRMTGSISARKWARAQAGSGPVAAALAGVFAAINNGPYKLDPAAQGCPLTDLNLGAKAHWKPRLPFLLSAVVTGGTDNESSAVTDEYAGINSVCRSDPSQDFEGG